MNENEMPKAWEQKVREVLEVSVAGLDPAERAERIAWCQETGQHGVAAEVDDEAGAVIFTWGGRTLAVVERATLVDDGVELPAGELIPGLPDTVPEDWAE